MTPIEIIQKLSKIYIKKPSERCSGETLLSNGNKHKYYAYRIINDKKEKRCIIGKCLRQGEWLDFEGTIRQMFNWLCQGDTRKFNLLFLPSYKGHSVDFWEALQKWHDSEEFWDDKGLTESGLKYIKDLINKYE